MKYGLCNCTEVVFFLWRVGYNDMCHWLYLSIHLFYLQVTRLNAFRINTADRWLWDFISRIKIIMLLFVSSWFLFSGFVSVVKKMFSKYLFLIAELFTHVCLIITEIGKDMIFSVKFTVLRDIFFMVQQFLCFSEMSFFYWKLLFKKTLFFCFHKTDLVLSR